MVVSDEHEASIWNVESLHAHVAGMRAEADRRYEQRFQDQEKAVAAALAAADRAVAKAELAANSRFDSVNEFRAQLTDQTATFLSRAEADTRTSALADRTDVALNNLSALLGALADRVGAIEGRSRGLNDGWGYVAGALGLIGMIISIIIAVN